MRGFTYDMLFMEHQEMSVFNVCACVGVTSGNLTESKRAKLFPTLFHRVDNGREKTERNLLFSRPPVFHLSKTEDLKILRPSWRVLIDHRVFLVFFVCFFTGGKLACVSSD